MKRQLSQIARTVAEQYYLRPFPQLNPKSKKGCLLPNKSKDTALRHGKLERCIHGTQNAAGTIVK